MTGLCEDGMNGVLSKENVVDVVVGFCGGGGGAFVDDGGCDGFCRLTMVSFFDWITTVLVFSVEACCCCSIEC